MKKIGRASGIISNLSYILIEDILLVLPGNVNFVLDVTICGRPNIFIRYE